MSDQHRVPVNPTTAQRIGSRVALSELSNPIVCAALELWREKKGSRAFPSRLEIVPKPIARILRNVMLIAMIEDQRDFEFRVVGDAARLVYGQNFQGMRQAGLNTLEPGFGDVIRKVCDSICRRRKPIGVKGIVEQADSFVQRHEGVFLPLGDCEERVDHVLFVGGYVPVDDFTDLTGL
jgi:hypothetical protein